MSAHGNLQKYQNENPLQRLLVRRFLDRVSQEIVTAGASTLLDVGSGEGFAASAILERCPLLRVTCLDLDGAALARGRSFFPALDFREGDARTLPFPDREFDAVQCLEVLEHLDDPGAAIRELRRVSRKHVIVSTPHEPWFRLANVLRGKNLRSFGNDPEHVNHWDPRSLRRLLEDDGLAVKNVRLSFPWMLLRCEKAGPAASTISLSARPRED